MARSIGHLGINTGKKGELGVGREAYFYKKLSQHCNYVDEASLRIFYLGLVQHVMTEVKEHGFCRLPYLGDFALIDRRMTHAFIGTGKGGTRTATNIGVRKSLTFYVRQHFRKYIYKFVNEDVKPPTPGGTVL